MYIYKIVIPFKQEAVAATFLLHFPYRIPILLLLLFLCFIFVSKFAPQYLFYPPYTDRLQTRCPPPTDVSLLPNTKHVTHSTHVGGISTHLIANFWFRSFIIDQLHGHHVHQTSMLYIFVWGVFNVVTFGYSSLVCKD